MAGILLNGEDMPQGHNRVSLHDTETDQYGLPAPVVHVEEHSNEIAMRKHFFGKAGELFEAVGARHVHTTVPLSATHNLGTCRMSDDPDNGVVNAWGRSHEIRNLFVSDGSQFTTSTCENPTLTIVALAIRQAEHIAGEMSRRQL
jgi:choline dehydrogenase-like flavoprotein